MDGFIFLAIVIPVLTFLSAGVFAQKMWAWWGSVFYLAFMGVSTVLTLIKVNFQDTIGLINFTEKEYEALKNVPIESVHMLIVILAPLLMALIVFIRSYREFVKRESES
jgi:hypothetical protein